MFRSCRDFYVRNVSVRWAAQYWMVCKARSEGQVLLELERQRLTLKYILRYSSYRAVNTLRLGYKTSQLMLCVEITAVCSKIHRKHQCTVWAERIIL
jgi:hypothetical protein